MRFLYIKSLLLFNKYFLRQFKYGIGLKNCRKRARNFLKWKSRNSRSRTLRNISLHQNRKKVNMGRNWKEKNKKHNHKFSE